MSHTQHAAICFKINKRRAYKSTRLKRSLVLAIKPPRPDNPRLAPRPPTLPLTLLPFPGHHSVKLGLYKVHLHTFRDEVTTRESVPFRTVTNTDRLVEILQRGKGPLDLALLFTIRLVVFGDRDRFVSQIGKDTRESGVLEMVNNIKWGVVKVVSGGDAAYREQAGKEDSKKGKVGEDGRAARLLIKES